MGGSLNNLIFVFITVVSIYLWSSYLAKSFFGLGAAVRFFTAAGFYLTAVSMSITLLAVIGIFSPAALNLLLALLHAPIIILNLRKKHQTDRPVLGTKAALDGYDVAAMIILPAAFLLYSLYPVNYIIGGRDPGVYYNLGIHIADKGSLLINDDFLRSNYNEIASFAHLDFPGLYSAMQRGVSQDPGLLIPQFLPMTPALLTIGYVLGGIQGLIRVNSLVAFLALISIYLFCKQTIGKKAGILAILFLILNPAELFGARITQTELLSQLLLFFSFILFDQSMKRNSTALAAASGLIMGIGCFNRVDSYLFGIGFLTVSAYMLLIGHKKSRLPLVSSAFFTIIAAASALYGYYYSNPYYSDLWNNGTLKGLLLLNLGFMTLVLIAYITAKLLRRQKTYNLRLYSKFISLKKKWLAPAVGLLMLTIFIAAYFIRPLLLPEGVLPGTDRYFQAYAMRDFTWYVPIAAIIVSIYGLYHMIRNRSVTSMVPFLIISLANIVGYIYRPSITHEHLWASRRWVTVNIPAIYILTAYGITRLRIKRTAIRNILIYGLTAYILVFSLWQSKPLIKNALFKDFDRQLGKAAEVIPDNALVLAQMPTIATPLNQLFDKDVYIVKNDYDIKKLSDYAKDKDTYIVGWPERHLVNLRLNNLEAVQIQALALDGRYIEETSDVFPRSLYQWYQDMSLYKLEYVPSMSYVFDVQSEFRTVNGVSEEIGFRSDGTSNYLLFGPFLELSTGKYTIEFEGQLMNEAITEDDIGYIDVVHKGASIILLKESLNEYLQDNNDIKGEITFTLENPVLDLEFRLFNEPGVDIWIKNVKITKIE